MLGLISFNSSTVKQIKIYEPMSYNQLQAIYLHLPNGWGQGIGNHHGGTSLTMGLVANAPSYGISLVSPAQNITSRY